MPERRIFRIMLVLAITTTVISLAMAAYEHSTYPKKIAKDQSAKTRVLAETLKPPFSPLLLLPDSVLQYEVKTRQTVPGSAYPAAEALYEILDPNIMLERPLNSYVKVTFFPSSEEAQKDIKETLNKRYPIKQEDLLLGNMVASAGYDQREGSFFIGWTKQSYSFKVFTTFLRHVPVNKKTSLRDYALPVAKAVESGASKISR